MFEVFRGVSPRFIEVFPFKESVSCDLRHVSQFETMLRAPLKLNILNYNLDIYSSKIWELVPPNIRNLETVAAFERAIEAL